MRKTFVAILCLSISVGMAAANAGSKDLLEKVGDFQFSPTAPNSYWLNSDSSYDYNQYEIEITSQPFEAKIFWNGTQIGATPMKYKFTGTLDPDDYVVIKAVPFDERFKPMTKAINPVRPLPRKIDFDFGAKIR